MNLDCDKRLSYATAQILQRTRPTRPFLLRTEGNSMFPLIPPGVTVRVQPSTVPPRVGEVVVRLHRGDTMIHRVVRRRRLRDSKKIVFLTKGDNAVRLDPPCNGAEIAGVVRGVQMTGEDARLSVKVFPHLSGVWIAHLSYSLGLLSGFLGRRMLSEQKTGRGRTISWLVLSLSRRLIATAIHFVARDFRRHAPPIGRSLRTRGHTCCSARFLRENHEPVKAPGSRSIIGCHQGPDKTVSDKLRHPTP